MKPTSPTHRSTEPRSPAELVDDAFIASHLRHLSEQLLEANLARLIEPFSCVEITHVSGFTGRYFALTSSSLRPRLGLAHRRYHAGVVPLSARHGLYFSGYCGTSAPPQLVKHSGHQPPLRPPSHVQIASLIGLPAPRVEAKLGAMILDRKLDGTLDAGRGTLLVFERPPADRAYAAALGTLDSLGTVVDALHRRADALK